MVTSPTRLFFLPTDFTQNRTEFCFHARTNDRKPRQFVEELFTLRLPKSTVWPPTPRLIGQNPRPDRQLKRLAFDLVHPDQMQNATFRAAGMSWFAVNLTQINGEANLPKCQQRPSQRNQIWAEIFRQCTSVQRFHEIPARLLTAAVKRDVTPAETVARFRAAGQYCARLPDARPRATRRR